MLIWNRTICLKMDLALNNLQKFICHKTLPNQLSLSNSCQYQQSIHSWQDIKAVTYWPSTEPSIKRCTCVNKRKNSETGASDRRYRNITLTRGLGWIRLWSQMRTPTGSRCSLDNYITRCHWRLGSVSSSQFQLQLKSIPVPVEDRMPAEWEPAPDRGLGPSVTHDRAAQLEYERSAAMVRSTWGQYVAVCPHLQLTSHTRPTSTLSRIKCERYIFYKEVYSFVHWSRHYCWLCFHLYLCSCMWLYNTALVSEIP